ncbi:MAG: Phosphocholine transferase AnkX [Candidatus Anoxychlamydiales bacterium]|nr:Phosphocholine transferase AnkX [Candidatus Anoxychlamydiales bacterium]
MATSPIPPSSFSPYYKEVEDLNRFLLTAVKLNLLDSVNSAITRGADISCRDNEGKTALHIAAENENIEIIEALLTKGKANPLTMCSEKHLTPFQSAILNGKLKAAKAIYEHCGENKDIIKNYTTKDDHLSPLMLACQTKNLEAVQFLLDIKVKVDFQNLQGDTALILASDIISEDDEMDIIDLLLKNRAKINDKNKKDFSPLKMAVKNQNIKLVEFLLKNEANAKDADEKNKTILMYASNLENSSILKLLIENDAEISAKDSRNNTALHYAANGEYPNNFIKLLENGADKLINEKNKKGLSAFFIMTQNEKFDVEYILKTLVNKSIKFDINTTNNIGTFPLMAATLSNKIELVKILLKHGADINFEDKNGDSSLIKAVKNQRYDIAMFLLKKIIEEKKINSDILEKFFETLLNALNKRDFLENLVKFETEEQDTIFHLAVKNKANLKNLFLNFNELKIPYDLNKKNKDGKTPLDLAIELDLVPATNSLLENEAKIDESLDEKENTILITETKKNKKTLESLIPHLNVNQTNKKNKTALHYASKMGNFATVELLLKNGAKDSSNFTSLMIAAKYDQTKCLETLLANPEIKEKINAKDNKGKTALIYATENNSVESLKLLVKNGANIRLPDNDQWIALYWASMKGNKEAVEYLYEVEKSYWWNYAAYYGKKALFLASGYGHIDLINLLVKDKKIDVNSYDSNNETPLHRACRWGAKDAVELLLKLGAEINAEIKNSLGSRFYQGKTPLMCAVESGNRETVELLLKTPKCVKTLNVENKYHENWTALDYARGFKIELVGLLMSYGAITHIN